MSRVKFDRSGKIYSEILESLSDQKKANKPAVLNIHIPGTGCRYNTSFPTYNALIQMKTQYNLGLDDGTSPAVLFLEGTGYDGDDKDYLSPALNKGNTLEKKRKETSFFSMFAGSAVSDMDLIAENEFTAKILGVIGGAGKQTNNERIMGALGALEEDKALPDVILLSGHSRGAINCISLANKIYEKYQKKIKVHLLLTDPVPGPGYGNAADTLIIPENVVSFTCFYAADEDRLFFIAHDHERLKFMNQQTTITSYPIKGNHINFFYALDSCQPYIDQIACTINGVNALQNTSKIQTFQKIDKSLSGKGYREGSVFHMVTPINAECSDGLGEVLTKLRLDIGDDTFDIELRNKWREKKAEFIEQIQKQVEKNLSFTFNFANRKFKMISDEELLRSSIEAEIKEFLSIFSAVLSETELAILLNDANYDSIVKEIVGAISFSKDGFDVRNGSGIDMSGLTKVYFNHLEKKQGNLVYVGVLNFLGFNTESHEVTHISDSLDDDIEKRKKELLLCVFEIIAKHATSEQIQILQEESKNLVSNRMRALRYERPSIVKENKIPQYIDTTSYKAYCNILKHLEADKKIEKKNEHFKNYPLVPTIFSQPSSGTTATEGPTVQSSNIKIGETSSM